MYGLVRPRQSVSIYLVASLCSLLLSYWSAIQQSVINPDAICYLTSAANMKLGVHAGMMTCGQSEWPLYSILIYGFATISKFSYETSAYLLDSLFSLMSVVIFISIVRFIHPKKSILWFAAIIILLSHEFNAVRQYIVRDHGFWAFYLLSIFMLLQFFKNHQWRYALLWNVSLIAATLFRIEGAAFLLLVPWIVWFDRKQPILNRFAHFIKLNIFTLLICMALCVWVTLHPQVNLARLHEIPYQMSHGISSVGQHFIEMRDAIAKYVLGADGARDANHALVFMMVSLYLMSIIVNLSLIYSALVIYAWIRGAMQTSSFVRCVLWVYIIANVVVTALFFAEHLFLAKRYLIALSLVFMVWVPFALDNLLHQWNARKWPLILAIFLMVVSSLGGIFDFGYSKKYIRESGDWLALHVPQQATLYSNDYQVMYYSQHFGNDLFQKARESFDLNVIAQGKWKQYDYLALRVDKKDLEDKTSVVNQIDEKPVQVFSNKRGDQVRIYRRGSL